MIDLSENSCYLTVVRPPTKTIQHCKSGNCEIERVSFTNRHSDLQYSIRHSKMLTDYKQKYPYSNSFTASQCDDLFQAKNIIDEKSKFYVAKVLRELHCTLYSCITIQKMKKEKYNPKSPHHESLLLKIWQSLKPHEKLQARVTDQWITIGFQANDPSTDFRGAGFLGLLNLERFCQTHQGKKAFQVASTQKTEFFFCSAGLFFTMLAAQLLMLRKISYEHWVHNSDEEMLNQFQKVYNWLFGEFILFWINQCPNKSILYFNQNLKNFDRIIKQWDQKMLRARLQDNS